MIEGKYWYMCDSADQWRMKGRYVGEFGSALLPDRLHEFNVSSAALSPSTCSVNNEAS